MTDKLAAFQRNMNRATSREVSTQKAEKHISEEGKLKALVSEDVWQLFEEAGVIIAGGAITSAFTNKDVNDLDVYFRSEEQLFRVVSAIYGQDNFVGELFDIAEQFCMIYAGASQRTLMFKNKEQDVQFMTFKYFDNAEEIFDTFDFTCCMGAYDFKLGGFVLHKDFLKHNAQKYLKFHPGTAYPIMSLMRVEKYRKKGYEISKTEMLRICATCMNLKLEGWEDLKDHVGGMYGYDLNDVFDEEKEFSLMEFVDQLDTLEERDIKKFEPFTGDHTDFWSVVRVFVKIDTGQEDPCFNDDKYLYKCVNEKWQSPIWSTDKITYQEGEIIEADGKGIFFHASSDRPYHRSKYWVEAEMIEGNLRDGDELGYSREKVVAQGKVKIIRCFEYDVTDEIYQKLVREKYEVNYD